MATQSVGLGLVWACQLGTTVCIKGVLALLAAPLQQRTPFGMPCANHQRAHPTIETLASSSLIKLPACPRTTHASRRLCRPTSHYSHFRGLRNSLRTSVICNTHQQPAGGPTAAAMHATRSPSSSCHYALPQLQLLPQLRPRLQPAPGQEAHLQGGRRGGGANAGSWGDARGWRTSNFHKQSGMVAERVQHDAGCTPPRATDSAVQSLGARSCTEGRRHSRTSAGSRCHAVCGGAVVRHGAAPTLAATGLHQSHLEAQALPELAARDGVVLVAQAQLVEHLPGPSGPCSGTTPECSKERAGSTEEARGAQRLAYLSFPAGSSHAAIIYGVWRQELTRGVGRCRRAVQAPSTSCLVASPLFRVKPRGASWPRAGRSCAAPLPTLHASVDCCTC
jgi:hypothetical protein